MQKRLPHQQKGIVLLGWMIVLLLISSAFFVNQANRLFTKTGQDSVDANALAQARDSLLARAISDGNRPGSLPCPALTSDGNAPGLPPCPTFIGWLPWRTLGLPDLRDSSGERLWYVLSPAFQDSGTINLNSSSALTLDGNTGIAALVIAPGPPLSNQNRPSNNVADYLDNKENNPATGNNDGDNNYFSGSASDTFNDKVLSLTTSALFSGVTNRILAEIRYAYLAAGSVASPADTDNDGLSNPSQYLGQFPYKEPIYAIDSTSWYSPSPPFHRWYDSLVNNGWFTLVRYDQVARTITLNGQVRSLQ